MTRQNKCDSFVWKQVVRKRKKEKHMKRWWVVGAVNIKPALIDLSISVFWKLLLRIHRKVYNNSFILSFSFSLSLHLFIVQTTIFNTNIWISKKKNNNNNIQHNFFFSVSLSFCNLFLIRREFENKIQFFCWYRTYCSFYVNQLV